MCVCVCNLHFCYKKLPLTTSDSNFVMSRMAEEEEEEEEDEEEEDEEEEDDEEEEEEAGGLYIRACVYMLVMHSASSKVHCLERARA